MAAQQTLIFTVMPNGLNAQKNGMVSLYLTPRLDNGATLAAFPDFLNWAGLVKQYGLKFQINCGGTTTTVAADTSVLRPDLWTSIFTSSTYVSPVTIPALDQRLIVSYPTRDVLAYMKYAWQSLGAGPSNANDQRSGIARVLNGLSFRDGSNSTLANEMSQMRLTLWREQQAGGNIAGGVGVAQAPASNLPLPPDGVASTAQAPFDTASLHTVATQFALYHHLPAAPNSPPLPSTPADFAKTLDFHSALTALSSYPALMRDLGLVFDVVLPAAACPGSPASSAYLTIAVTQLTLGTAWKINPTLQFPATQYYNSGAIFSAAPATTPANLTSAQYQAGDVVAGQLVLDPSMFNLTQMDVDGGMLKALALADNVTLSPTEAAVEDVLPSLRSSGVALMASGRALQLLQAISNNISFDQALQSGAQPRPFNALDLVRGYRIDIWSSRTKQWHSLHRRDSVYAFGATGSIKVTIQDEEGFVQLATTSAAPDPTRQPDPVATANNIPQPDTDIYVHERVSRWEGWSLSAPRPGGVMNRSADPSVDTVQDPAMNAPITPFKMQASFNVHSGTLPPLRFGDLYRLRVRAVDLCGNSAAPASNAVPVFALPASATLFPYLRFEPVPPPLVILRSVPGSGGSLENLVIRSYNNDPSLDSTPATDLDDRHIAPPRASERLAEQHGMYDDAQGKLRGDSTMYNEIVARDNYELPKLPGPGGAPIEPDAALAPLYIPDPLSRGAAIRNLPYTPNNSNGAIDASDDMVYSTLPDVQPRTGSVTWVGFGDEWPSLTTFRLAIVEGDGPPIWDGSERVLTVSLAKSVEASVDLSSYMTESDLKLMGVWAWLREFIQALEYEAVTNSSAWSTVEFVADLAALLTRLVLEGGHEMITPARTLTLTHAVQQPLGRPAFTQLPVVHQPTQPIFASGLRNSFTPITAWRSVGSHAVALLGGLQIHGQSSVKIELQATWPEIIDDVSKPKPVESWQADHVDTVPLATTDPGMIYADSSESRAVGIYIPQTDMLWFAGPFDDLEGVDTPYELAAPIHRLNDTLHRWIGYQAVATSRYQEYFEDQSLVFTRGSNTLVVDVPSSARPAAPDILYVLPTFGWEQQETTTMKSSVRFGNGLRVWLNRPWYSSGDNEMLGIVLWSSAAPAPDYGTRELYKPLFTQWGCDPVWKTQQLFEMVPSTYSFVNAATATGLTLEETTAQVFDVAAFPVTYDETRKLWFCDIEIESLPVYTPFIRLALARYQSHSIQGVELSRVVLADFAQLAPDRSAVLSIQPSDPRNGRLVVGGLAPEGPLSPAVMISVEQRVPGVESDLAWQAAPASVVTVTEDSPNPSQPDSVLWSGLIVFANTPANDQFRVVVREFEQITETPGTDLTETATASRLVYATIFAWNYQ